MPTETTCATCPLLRVLLNECLDEMKTDAFSSFSPTPDWENEWKREWPEHYALYQKGVAALTGSEDAHASGTGAQR